MCESKSPVTQRAREPVTTRRRNELKFEKDAAYSFLETALKYRQDRALFATFDSQVELHQDFTNRLDLLTKAIDKVKAQGSTRMYDAIYSVCEEKMMAPTSLGRRHAMVVITDGCSATRDWRAPIAT